MVNDSSMLVDKVNHLNGNKQLTLGKRVIIYGGGL